MFGFGKKKDVVAEKEEVVKEYMNIYRIRGIYLADGYNQKIFTKTIREYGENGDVTAAYQLTENRHPSKIRIYILYENDDNGMGFHYGTWEYVDNRWVASDDISRIKFYDGPSKIIYKCTDYCATKSDGSKEYRTESVLQEILVNRNGNMPIM